MSSAFSRLLSASRGHCGALLKSVAQFQARGYRKGISPSSIRTEEFVFNRKTHVIIPALFTAGFSAAVYLGAAANQQPFAKTLVERFLEAFEVQDLQENKNRSLAEQIKLMILGIESAQRIAIGVTAANVVVFLLWRVRKLHRFMNKWFVHRPLEARLTGMVTSTFSHRSFWHFLGNMVVFNLVAPSILYRMSGNEFVPMYFTGGVMASLAYQVHAVLTRQSIGGIGATGAIYSLLTVFALQQREAEISFGDTPIKLDLLLALSGLIAVDIVGLVFRWQAWGHAAHLGGAAFGLLHYLWGHESFSRTSKMIRGD